MGSVRKTRVVRVVRHGVSQATFGYLDSYAWHRITQWLLNGTSHLNRAELYRRFLTGGPGNRPAVGGLG